MGLINFTIDLKIKDQYQPVLAFESTGNAFLTLAKFKGQMKSGTNNIFELKGIVIRLESLTANGKYVILNCCEYIDKSSGKNPRVILKFKISNHRDMKKHSFKAIDEFIINGKDKIEFQVSFDESDCKGDVSMIDNGNWPCNLNTIA